MSRLHRRTRALSQLATGLALAGSGAIGCFAQTDSRELSSADAAPSGDGPTGSEARANDDVSLHTDAKPDVSLDANDGGATGNSVEASDSTAPRDGNDGALRDVVADAGPRASSDGPSEAAAPDASFGDFTDPGNWESVAAGIGSGLPGGGGFIGGAFDGRYVYFAPTFNGGTLARYDTRAPFTMASSWAHLDLKLVDLGSQADAQVTTSFAGAVFDGRYLYLAPFENQPGHAGVALQCDTRAPGGCIAPASWSAFSLSALVGSPCGYAGAVYDGRYVNFVPFVETQSGGPFTVMARFDTQAGGGFASAASWSTLRMDLAVPTTRGAYGAVFDGRRIYFISSPAIPSIITAFDTTRPLGDFGAWSGFDMATDAGAGQLGGAFDGRFVYLTPAPVYFSMPMTVARCDTEADGGCSSAAEWARFDVGSVSGPDAAIGQYGAAAYDGRFLIFAPYTATTVALRYDTTRPFASSTSWSHFDLAARDPSAIVGYTGAVFDGEYVYLVPLNSSYFVRFHARRPAAPPGPPSWGSFY